MLPYQIKSAGIDDLPVIVELANNIWHSVYASILSQDQITYMLGQIYTVDSLLQQMQQEGQNFLILYVENEPAGFASYSDKGDTVFKLNKLYVLQSLHGKGLGRILITQVEQLAKARGGKTLELNVNRLNPAKSFYEKIGFKVLKEEDIPIGPYWMNDYIMSKPIE